MSADTAIVVSVQTVRTPRRCLSGTRRLRQSGQPVGSGPHCGSGRQSKPGASSLGQLGGGLYSQGPGICARSMA
jgi:hypothetical protein